MQTPGTLVRERAFPTWPQVRIDPLGHAPFRQTLGEKQLGNEGPSLVRERPLPEELEAQKPDRRIVRGDSHTEGDAQKEDDRFQSRWTGEQLFERAWIPVREQRRRPVQFGGREEPRQEDDQTNEQQKRCQYS